MNHLLSILLLILLPVGGVAYAEEPKPFIPEEPDMKGFWWPVYIDSSGAKKESFYGLTLGQYPTDTDGAPLDDIETVIYARALYKPRMSGVSSLEELIEDEQTQFRNRTPETEISTAEPVQTKEGEALRSYTYVPKKSGSWERVTYSEEGDFYLLFTIRSQNQQRYQQDLDAYFNYIRKYRKPLINSARQISAQHDFVRLRGEQQRSRYKAPTPPAGQEGLRVN
jgi:hypothetical protein